MVTVTIDGSIHEARGDERLIDLINRTGTELAQVCYHPQLGAIQTCDTCLVDTEQSQFVERRCTYLIASQS